MENNRSMEEGPVNANHDLEAAHYEAFNNTVDEFFCKFNDADHLFKFKSEYSDLVAFLRGLSTVGMPVVQLAPWTQLKCAIS
jgi:hypothetical protein